MIDLDKFWRGRNTAYADQLNDDIVSNAEETVKRVNVLLSDYENATGLRITRVTSGWRPPEINNRTEGAARKSNHVLGRAVDVADPDGALDAWLMNHASVLAYIGLWMEHPDATPGWCHLQIVPPRSGNRIFRP